MCRELAASIATANKETLWRANRFIITGAMSTGVYVGSAVVLISKLGIVPIIANEIAFLIAVCVSYVAHSLWSFSSNMTPRSLLRYLAVTFLAFICTGVIVGTVDRLGGSYWLGISLVVLIIPSITFLLHSTWTYKH